jgi:hypothetical protein
MTDDPAYHAHLILNGSTDPLGERDRWAMSNAVACGSFVVVAWTAGKPRSKVATPSHSARHDLHAGSECRRRQRESNSLRKTSGGIAHGAVWKVAGDIDARPWIGRPAA